MPAQEVQIIGGAFNDVLGNPISYGTLEFLLNQDEVIQGVGEICAGIKVIANLAKSGNVNGTDTFPITSTQVTANVLTVVAGVTNLLTLLSVGDNVVFPSTLAATAIAGQTVVVATVSNTGFTAAFTTANYGSTPEVSKVGTIGVAVLIWPNDAMTPLNSFYRVSVYNSKGELSWGPNQQQVLSTTLPNPYNITTWLPNAIPNWTPQVMFPSIQINNVPTGSQTLLDLIAGANITLTDNGVGGITIASFSAATTEPANTVFAGPSTGVPAAATFRALVTADLPALVSNAGVVVDGGNSSPATGSKGYSQVPYNAIIVGWTILADVSGSLQITVKKSTFAGFPTTASIVASAPPALVTQQSATSTVLTGWTTTITAGDVLEFNLDSITTIKRFTLMLKIQRT